MKRKGVARNGLVGNIVIASGAGLVVVLIGTAITALLIHHQVLKEEYVGYGIVMILLCSGISAGTLSSIRSKEMKVICSIISAAVVVIMLMLINMLTITEGIYGFWPTMLIISGSSLAVGILSIAPNKKSKSKRIKF